MFTFMANSGCWRFADANRLPRESDQVGVTDPKHSADDLSWMTSTGTDKLHEVRRLAKEIRGEGVTDGEKVSFIEHFEDLMGRTNDIVTCACCGRREVNRKSGSSFHLLPLSSEEVQMLKMSEAETEQLRAKLEVSVEIPINSSWDTVQVHPGLVQSFYFDDNTDFGCGPNASAYHLHREFVTVPLEASKDPEVPICEACFSTLKNGKLPKHSIAKGTDYGSIHRLEHPLVTLNKAEKCAISRVRLYQCIIKTKVTQTVTRHIMNSHCITFSHDAAEKSFDALKSDEMNDPALLCDAVQMVFVGPKGERDNLARATFSSERVFLRSYALAQWARVLSVCNKNYSHIKLSVATKAGATSFVQQCKRAMDGDSRHISGEADLRFENSIGDDTANVRTAKETQAPKRNSNDEVAIEGVTYTHVTDSLDSNHPDKDSARSDFLAATKDVFRTKKKKKHDILIQSKRSQDPFNEFYDNHTVITMAHPTVFLLGTLFGHDQETQGSLTRLDRNHMLNQFTNAAATDQDLNFFMFDQDQRHSNTRGVVGKVRTNKAAFDKFAEMHESKEFQSDLDHVVKNPSGKVAKDVIGKVLPVIRASGSKTTLGPLQSPNL